MNASSSRELEIVSSNALEQNYRSFGASSIDGPLMADRTAVFRLLVESILSYRKSGMSADMADRAWTLTTFERYSQRRMMAERESFAPN